MTLHRVICDGRPRTKPFIPPRPAAFTLVELLVVVAIIALLLAILMPVLTKVKMTAMRTACMSQFHGIGIAQLNYATDNRSKLAPHARWDVSTIFSRSFGGWADTVDKWTGNGLLIYRGYLENPKAAWCPANTAPGLAFDDPGHGWREDPYNEGDRWMAQSVMQRTDIKTTSDPKLSASATSIGSDGFTNYGNGVDGHHLVGYSVLYLDASANFYYDPDRVIKDLGVPGGKGGGVFAAQSAVYDEYFDR